VAAQILYVDDEPQNVRLFQRVFGDDLEIVTAASGHEALQLLARNDIGVIVSDQRMPGLSGIELLSQVATRSPEIGRILSPRILIASCCSRRFNAVRSTTTS
jgi:CheY-like chemotaxis protein